MNDTATGAVIGAVIVAGASFIGNIVTHYLAKSTRREEQEEDRRVANESRLADVYKRALQAAADFRWLSQSPNAQEQWKAFLPRFHELRAEFTLYATKLARVAFNKYIDDIEQREYQSIMTNQPDEYWSTIDGSFEKLAEIIRTDLAARRGGADV